MKNLIDLCSYEHSLSLFYDISLSPRYMILLQMIESSRNHVLAYFISNVWDLPFFMTLVFFCCLNFTFEWHQKDFCAAKSTLIIEPKINLYKWCRKIIKPNILLYFLFTGINSSKFIMEAPKFEIEKYYNKKDVVQKMILCDSSY